MHLCMYTCTYLYTHTRQNILKIIPSHFNRSGRQDKVSRISLPACVPPVEIFSYGAQDSHSRRAQNLAVAKLGVTSAIEPFLDSVEVEACTGTVWDFSAGLVCVDVSERP